MKCRKKLKIPINSEQWMILPLSDAHRLDHLVGYCKHVRESVIEYAKASPGFHAEYAGLKNLKPQ